MLAAGKVRPCRSICDDPGLPGTWCAVHAKLPRTAGSSRSRPSLSAEPPRMSPVVEPLSWMLGTWLSEPPGAGTFPTLQPFRYLEEAHISHVGQPMLNFS